MNGFAVRRKTVRRNLASWRLVFLDQTFYLVVGYSKLFTHKSGC